MTATATKPASPTRWATSRRTPSMPPAAKPSELDPNPPTVRRPAARSPRFPTTPPEILPAKPIPTATRPASASTPSAAKRARPIRSATTTYYVYDGDNNVVKTTDPDGQVITDAYNDLNQLTQENWFNSSEHAHQHDQLRLRQSRRHAHRRRRFFQLHVFLQRAGRANQRRQQRQRPGRRHRHARRSRRAARRRSYDTLGNRTSLDASIDGTADFQNAYSFDGFGREASVSQSGIDGGNAVADKLVTFSYNADNQFTTIDRYSDLTGSTLVAASGYGYDAIGRLTSLDQGNSTSSTAYAGYGFTLQRRQPRRRFHQQRPHRRERRLHLQQRRRTDRRHIRQRHGDQRIVFVRSPTAIRPTAATRSSPIPTSWPATAPGIITTTPMAT